MRRKLTKKLEQRLDQLKIKYDAYLLKAELISSIRSGNGKWNRNGSVFWDDVEGIGVVEDGNGVLCARNDLGFQVPVEDPELIDIVKALSAD